MNVRKEVRGRKELGRKEVNEKGINSQLCQVSRQQSDSCVTAATQLSTAVEL